MAAAADNGRPAPQRDWVQKYPPLLTVFVALLLALVVMPSALNLPQTNPTQTLEYAPVPPSDDEPPPPQGNLSALGLGSSSAVRVGGAQDGNNESVIPPIGQGKSPTNKRCVGSPPRQSEDPLAPPCVAFFQGDNFGATYQGVTRDEVRILIYLEGNITHLGGSQGRENRPQNQYFDLFQPPDPKGEHTSVRGFRAYQRYFNDRFQTYGRAVHFFVYYGGNDNSPEARRSDAADNYSKVHPFAVITSLVQGNEEDYVDAMAKHGVLNFGSFSGKSEKFFQKFPKLIWGYYPTLEYQSELYTTYVCGKAVPHPASMSGNALDNGQPRKFGMWHTDDENWPGLIFLYEIIKKKVEACGAEIVADATFPKCCYAQDNGQTPDYAATAMAQFKQDGITTILWTGGIEDKACRAAQAISYFPEWVILGDGVMDTNWPEQLSGNTNCFDNHAVTPTSETLEPAQRQQFCVQAITATDPTYEQADFEYACEYYRYILQLFIGIQVAGPRLGPTSVDKGMHAIPPVRPNNPHVPACYYHANDYSCVKDGQAEYWDAQGQPPGDNRPGCWRAIEGGRRVRPGEWAKGNINAQITGQEPCNTRSVRVIWLPA